MSEIVWILDFFRRSRLRILFYLIMRRLHKPILALHTHVRWHVVLRRVIKVSLSV